MEYFFSWIVIALLVSLLFAFNADFNASNMQYRINTGEELCQQHGGLESFDMGGDFSCKNATIIQKKGESK